LAGRRVEVGESKRVRGKKGRPGIFHAICDLNGRRQKKSRYRKERCKKRAGNAEGGNPQMKKTKAGGRKRLLFPSPEGPQKNGETS